VTECPYHRKLEFQIKNLEADVKELQITQRDPRIWVAVFSFLGVCFSTLGSLLGVVLSYYFRAQGIF
jgi:hypothetical protein